MDSSTPGYTRCVDSWLLSGPFSRLSLSKQIFLRSSVCFSVSLTEFRVSRDLQTSESDLLSPATFISSIYEPLLAAFLLPSFDPHHAEISLQCSY